MSLKHCAIDEKRSAARYLFGLPTPATLENDFPTMHALRNGLTNCSDVTNGVNYLRK